MNYHCIKVKGAMSLYPCKCLHTYVLNWGDLFVCVCVCRHLFLQLSERDTGSQSYVPNTLSDMLCDLGQVILPLSVIQIVCVCVYLYLMLHTKTILK